MAIEYTHRYVNLPHADREQLDHLAELLGLNTHDLLVRIVHEYVTGLAEQVEPDSFDDIPRDSDDELTIKAAFRQYDSGVKLFRGDKFDPLRIRPVIGCSDSDSFRPRKSVL